MKTRLHTFLHRLGADVVRYDGRMFFAPKRMELIRMVDIDLIIDVGANTGQYVRELREHGYEGRIVSFEPLPDAYAELASSAGRDALWEAVNAAAGADAGITIIHRSRNSWSSSLLPSSSALVTVEPDTEYVADEQTKVVTLDSYGFLGRILLKIDVQGYEDEVLAGGRETFEKARLIELELPLVELYEGQGTLLGEKVRLMYEAGFYLAALSPSFTNPSTHEILHCDAIFVRRAALPPA